LWTDNSPGRNILHGQWSSPTVAVIGGVPQVIFGGGDGWVYSFKADKGQDGKGELLWKFDINPKDSILELGGRGTRNDIISTPVIYSGKSLFCTGQDPGHGESSGILWCIDPTKRGDIRKAGGESRGPEQADPGQADQAVVGADGDLAIDTELRRGLDTRRTMPTAAAKLDFGQFHRSISTVAIRTTSSSCPISAACSTASMRPASRTGISTCSPPLGLGDDRRRQGLYRRRGRRHLGLQSDKEQHSPFPRST
jgi:hypothetical protein